MKKIVTLVLTALLGAGIYAATTGAVGTGGPLLKRAYATVVCNDAGDSCSVLATAPNRNFTITSTPFATAICVDTGFTVETASVDSQGAARLPSDPSTGYSTYCAGHSALVLVGSGTHVILWGD